MIFMTPKMMEVLLDFKEELAKPRPNLQKVYEKWAGPNFNDFAVAVKKLYDEGYLSMPKKDIVMGGDGDIPIDIVVDNIKITKKGYLRTKE